MERQFEKAREYFEKAAQLIPTDSEMWFNYGTALLSMKQFVESEKMFRKALECNPHHWKSMTNLSNILIDSGRCEEAREMIDAALKLAPKNDVILERLDETWARRCGDSKRRKAEDLLRRTALGERHLQTGKYDDAAAIFREILDEDPMFAPALNDLKIALIKEGKAMVRVFCAGCREVNEVSVFPSDEYMALIQKSAFAQRYGEVADSVRLITCEKCGRSTMYTFALCSKCFNGWIGDFMTDLEFEGSTVKYGDKLPCTNLDCRNHPKMIQFKTKDELILFSNLMTYRPQLSDMSKAIARLINEVEKHGKEEKS